MKDVIVGVAVTVLASAILAGFSKALTWLKEWSATCRPPADADIREYGPVVVFGTRPSKPSCWKHKLWWMILWRFDPTWKGGRPSSWYE